MACAPQVYSVGYGNRPIGDFFELIRRYGIHAICDVRSSPYSSRFPDFAREPFALRVKEEGLRYVFMGDVLGARPSDPEVYEAGRASYTAMARSSAFRQGLERLEVGAAKYKLAIMCAEKDPMDCHRSILITRYLDRDGLDVLHIDGNGEIESQRQLESRLLRHCKLQQTALFNTLADAEATNEAYERRGRELAYDVDAAYAARGNS